MSLLLQRHKHVNQGEEARGEASAHAGDAFVSRGTLKGGKVSLSVHSAGWFICSVGFTNFEKDSDQSAGMMNLSVSAADAVKYHTRAALCRIILLSVTKKRV